LGFRRLWRSRAQPTADADTLPDIYSLASDQTCRGGYLITEEPDCPVMGPDCAAAEERSRWDQCLAAPARIGTARDAAGWPVLSHWRPGAGVMRGGPGRGRGSSWSAAHHSAAPVPYPRHGHPPGWNMGTPGDRGTRFRLGAMGSRAARGAVRFRTAGYGRDGDPAAGPSGSNVRTRQQPGLGCPGGGHAGMVPGRSPAALPGGPRLPIQLGRTCRTPPRPGPAGALVIFAVAQMIGVWVRER
jgi:hypothetical protein